MLLVHEEMKNIDKKGVMLLFVHQGLQTISLIENYYFFFEKINLKL